MQSGFSRRAVSGRRRNFQQNHGQPGVVYILENPGLRAGWWKIGCSRRSGADRARELNAEATTGTPGVFRCIFEFRTLDCGRAEQRVFAKLATARRGKRGQEYFEVDLDIARSVIYQVCGQLDLEVNPPTPPAPSPSPSPAPPSQSPPVQPPSVPITQVPGSASADRQPPPSALPTGYRSTHPERFCGYCRTLVIPKTKLLFMKYCPRCGNSM